MLYFSESGTSEFVVALSVTVAGLCDCPFVDFISFWIECSIIVILSSCVACLSAELLSSRRLFPEEDLPLDDDTLRFVILTLTYYNLSLRHLLMEKDTDSRKLETVLVMQGGGSLGAYECGIYKALKTW